MDDARLLTGDQQTAIARSVDENRRRSEVVVWSLGFRTVGAQRRWQSTAHRVRIVLGQLARPQHLSSLEVERNESVSGARDRIGIAVAGRDVDASGLEINRWRRPHR